LLPYVQVSKKTKLNQLVREPVSIGEHLKVTRLSRKLLQKDVADLIGVSTFTIANWEKEKNVPAVFNGEEVIKFLGFMPLPTNTLAERFYATRFKNGWSQEVAAAHFGVGEDHWQLFEAGVSTKQSRDTERVERFFGLYLS
jgi:DNA-binding XRE family transcriptional regulator